MLTKITNSLTSLIYGTQPIKHQNNSYNDELFMQIKAKRVMSKLKKGFDEIKIYNIYKEVFEKEYPGIKIHYGSKIKKNQANNAESSIDDKNFSKNPKQKADLCNMVLENIIFDETDFSESIMNNSDFIDVSFIGCLFAKVNSNSNFKNCNFKMAFLADCNFIQAKFDNCNFEKANLSSTKFVNCPLIIKDREIIINSSLELDELLKQENQPQTKSFFVVGSSG